MSTTPGLDGAPAQDSADARAHHIIKRADQFVHDGALSVLELCTFLPHTEHEGFLEWLMKDRYHAGGHWDYHAHLREADKNADHQINLEELVAAVQAWMDDGSPGLSVPHAHAEKSKLSDKEKQLLAFRVQGPPDVILPPPPRKKKSIYEKSLPHQPTMGSTMSRTGFPQMSFEGKTGLRSRGESPLLLSHDDVAKSATGKAWASAQAGQPQNMADWFATWGRPQTKDFETLSSRAEYLQGIGAKPQAPEERW